MDEWLERHEALGDLLFRIDGFTHGQCRRAFRTNLKKSEKINFRSLLYSFRLIGINN